MDPSIKLAGQVPVASGSLQIVYQHPTEPDYLIKILRRDKARERWLRKSRGLPIQRKFGLYNAWVREFQEYVATRSRSPDDQCPEFMQRHYGLVETDLGLGLMVGKVTDRNGELAPDLGRVAAQHGFDDELRRKLSDLQSRIEVLNLVTTDISARNILLGWSEAHGEHLVVIEGFGANTLIPVKSMVPYLNRRSIRRHFARTTKQLERFDAGRFPRRGLRKEPPKNEESKKEDSIYLFPAWVALSLRWKVITYAVGTAALFITFVAEDIKSHGNWQNVNPATLRQSK